MLLLAQEMPPVYFLLKTYVLALCGALFLAVVGGILLLLYYMRIKHG